MQCKQSRRSVLRAIAASAALPALTGCISAGRPGSDPGKTVEPTDWIGETDDVAVYVEGLDVDLETVAETVRGADLAVFGGGARPSHDDVVDAVDGGAAVAVTGDRASRALVSAIRDVTPANVAELPDPSSDLTGDIDRPFGYELPATPAAGSSLAYPAEDGTLELHARVAEYGSDRQALNATVGQYLAATTRPRTATVASHGTAEDWRRRGRVSITAGQCPGGLVERVVDCYSIHLDDTLVFWRFRDSMTPGVSADSKCAGDPAGRNDRSFRRMTYGGTHDGEILGFAPTTSDDNDTASVQLTEFGDSWTYDVPDVTVLATENHTENAIRWEHEVERDSPVADTPFVTEPGVVVSYPSTPSVATHDWEVAFDFRSGGGEAVSTVEATGTGAWQID